MVREGFPPSNKHWPNVVLMLGQRRRRWASIKTTLCQRLLLAGFGSSGSWFWPCTLECDPRTCKQHEKERGKHIYVSPFHSLDHKDDDLTSNKTYLRADKKCERKKLGHGKCHNLWPLKTALLYMRHFAESDACLLRHYDRYNRSFWLVRRWTNRVWSQLISSFSKF